MSSQPQRRGRPVTEPNSLPRSRERRADVVGELGGKRARAHARGVRLDDAEHVVEKLRPDAGARSGGAREAVRRRDVRIGAVVDVEQRALRALEQQRLAARARVLQQRRDVGDHRLQLGGEPERLVERPRERDGIALEILREHEVVEFEQRRELRGEAIRDRRDPAPGSRGGRSCPRTRDRCRGRWCRSSHRPSRLRAPGRARRDRRARADRPARS